MLKIYHKSKELTIISALKMKKEIVIVPNPNQALVLRALQKEVCAALSQKELAPLPSYPLVIKSARLSHLTHEITHAAFLSDTPLSFDGTTLALNARLTLDGEEAHAQFNICTLHTENARLSDEVMDTLTALSNAKLAHIKKISPFRLAEQETEEMQNGRIWHITAEKWKKLP